MHNTKHFVLLCMGLTTLLLGGSCPSVARPLPVTETPHDLIFDRLATRWDEALPMGNAFVGALVWQRDSALRLSLDRIDLWDLRPTDSLSGERFSYEWVYQQWKNGTYANVQRKLDAPYDQLPAPSKIPGAALEFDIRSLGEVESARLYLADALTRVEWKNGTTLWSFVSATEPLGWFRFEGLPSEIIPQLLTPRYQSDEEVSGADPVSGQDLRRLGYQQGKVTHRRLTDGGIITYHQPGYGTFSYDVAVAYRMDKEGLTGAWSVTSSLGAEEAEALVEQAMKRSMTADYRKHRQWWQTYWDKSSVTLPDKVLERQYAAEIYKFGSVSRANSPIIPLQGVWTADNGLLPPWKGDVHHDLNTQLSYWPCYTGNHLEEGFGYLQTLWNQRETNRAYTEAYYGCPGLNVPGVATLTGEPMGGWIQYSLSPTISAWLAHHFYLHWQYSADPDFLREMGYPYLKEVATFLEAVTVKNEAGERTLRISSSPEIYDNTPQAWFPTITNFDLALIRSAFSDAAEMASALGMTDDAAHWSTLKAELPAFDVDSAGALTFAHGHPYDESHRHFSNALAIHPLSLLDVTHSDEEARIVQSTIDRLDQYGGAWWTGYSYSWLGNMKARALDGEGAAAALRDFADYFCLPNTFHANGQQRGTGKSNFTYRPFTLEGNFAFAAGIQEMLLQSHTDVVRVFPAIPADWNDVSFRNLRARGAFLISATRENGITTHVDIESERGGTIRLQNPFAEDTKPKITGAVSASLHDGIWEIQTREGSCVRMHR